MTTTDLRLRIVANLAASGLCLAMLLMSFLGCERNRPTRRVMPSDERKMAIDAGQDHLNLAFEFLDGFHKYAEREIIPRIHYHLSEWLKTQEADADWIADPMFGRLPSRLNLANRPATLSRLEFTDADVVMLREALWIRDVARQVSASEVDDLKLAAWLADESSGFTATQIRDLRYVIESFDWSVRNVQLESVNVAVQIAETTGAELPTKGAFRTSWESLLIARGEAETRARIMILVCRQLNIPVVMLGIESKDDDTADPTPWALAALIGEDLFLFDAKLGLPIPSKDRKGIATLKQVIEDATILDALSLGDKKYSVAAADLDRVVAMIDATIPYLSQRMTLLERKLTGDRKIKLSVSPSSLAQELRKCKGISNVQIWPLPYDALRYRRGQMKNQQLMARLSAVALPFSGDTALANGRRLHIAGKYRSDPPVKGAKAYYMACRVPNSTIERPRFTEEIREVLDLPNVSLGDDPNVIRQFVAVQSARLRFFKRHASYWLGVIALEEGKFEVAEDYLKKRTLEANPGGDYEDGARYCLARSYEGRGKRDNDPAMIEKAIELYEADSSPQATGNKLRAKWLKEE